MCLSSTNLSKALNLHLSLMGLSQVSLRKSQVVSGESQVNLRSVSGQSQVSLRSVSGLEALLTHFVVQSEPKILRLVKLKGFHEIQKG